KEIPCFAVTYQADGLPVYPDSPLAKYITPRHSLPVQPNRAPAVHIAAWFAHNCVFPAIPPSTGIPVSGRDAPQVWKGYRGLSSRPRTGYRQLLAVAIC